MDETNLELTKLLLQHGADPNQAQTSKTHSESKRNWTPLHQAASKDVAESASPLVKLLLESGATVDSKCVYNGVGNVTPLHLTKTDAAVNRLIEVGTSIFAVDSEGQIPLF
jgi:ankyrin repeat protein